MKAVIAILLFLNVLIVAKDFIVENANAQRVRSLPSLDPDSILTVPPQERCYRGVVYIVFSHGLTVKLDRDGKTEPCIGG